MILNRGIQKPWNAHARGADNPTGTGFAFLRSGAMGYREALPVLRAVVLEFLFHFRLALTYDISREELGQRVTRALLTRN